MPVLQRRFQDAVREALEQRGWNQAELARRMGVSAMYVSQYLSGRNAPGLEVVERFARGLGVAPHELFLPETEKISASQLTA